MRCWDVVNSELQKMKYSERSSPRGVLPRRLAVWLVEACPLFTSVAVALRCCSSARLQDEGSRACFTLDVPIHEVVRWPALRVCMRSQCSGRPVVGSEMQRSVSERRVRMSHTATEEACKLKCGASSASVTTGRRDRADTGPGCSRHLRSSAGSSAPPEPSPSWPPGPARPGFVWWGC